MKSEKVYSTPSLGTFYEVHAFILTLHMSHYYWHRPVAIRTLAYNIF